jgi:hydrogenase maturation factor
VRFIEIEIKVVKLTYEKQIKKYQARYKSVRKNMSIKVIFTAENRKYMHVGLAINVIQTAQYQKYMHVGFAINVIQTAKYRKYMHI